MGIPSMHRWLVTKYPEIEKKAKEIQAKIRDGLTIPVDIRERNPNGFEIDSFYIDMNSLIHPCCHPENKPPPQSEEEMMMAIFTYLDRIINIVRPRRLLYMAVDGVAPRAKLNQQRARRFRASKESTEKYKLLHKIREELEIKGVKLPELKTQQFNSNSITPGTAFMEKLERCLEFYICDRLNLQSWNKLLIILSGSSVPGEGEHKIMNFIRRQSCQDDYDHTATHCLYGADADLIILGLLTHLPNFFILREEYRYYPKPCDLCGAPGHELKDCFGPSTKQYSDPPHKKKSKIESTRQNDVKFLLIHLKVLRKRLLEDLALKNVPFQVDQQRLIEDFVFLTFLVGNDFLPHIPSLEIREGAINQLVKIYKKVVQITQKFITDDGHIDLTMLQLIMSDIANLEADTFKKRRKNELEEKEKDKKKRKEQIASESLSTVPPGLKRKRDSHPEIDSEQNDNIRFYEDGYQERYYSIKFGVDKNDVQFRHRLVSAYVKGLSWVLQYYFHGCQSWSYFYPFHYAPLATTFQNLETFETDFVKGEPFSPLEQLMAVLPGSNHNLLPKSWGELMMNDNSPILDFYPSNFETDLNGKKYEWQGVALLPFIDDQRLLDAVKPLYSKLTDEEMKRNQRGTEKIFFSTLHIGYSHVVNLKERSISSAEKEEQTAMLAERAVKETTEFASEPWGGGGVTVAPEVPDLYEIDPKLFDGLAGRLVIEEGVIEPKKVTSPVLGLFDLPENMVVCITYYNPDTPASSLQSASVGVPPAALKTEDDLKKET